MSTTGNGYDYAHKKARARIAPTVRAGHAYCTEPICLEPTRWIHPDSTWHLAHTPDRQGYHGPAHQRCNTTEGATRGNQMRRGTYQPTLATQTW